MNRTMHKVGRAVACGLLAATMAAAAGCYNRVVRSDGFGPDGVDTYEPNLKEDDKPLKEQGWSSGKEKDTSWRDR